MPPRLPIVTVVIPTYSRPALVLRAIRSALAQSFTALEVLVVIDGPDPDTVRAIEGVQDERLRYLELDEKVGGAEARNVGARAGEGQWIALLDDDDEWLPAKLTKQLEAVGTRDVRSVLVATQHLYRVDGAADVVRPRRMPKPGEQLSEFMFDHLCYFQTSTFLCSRELFLRVPFDRTAPFFQDIDWFLRLTHEPDLQFIVVEEPLTIYHVPVKRKTITASLGWRSRLEWGKSRRHLLSPRAYSRFVVGSCAVRAVQDGAGWRGLGRMLYETVVNGSPTPYLVMLLLGAYLMPPKLRQRVRDLLFLRRPALPAKKGLVSGIS